MNKTRPISKADMEFRAGLWNGHRVRTAWCKQTNVYHVTVDDLPAVDVKGDLALARYLEPLVREPKLLPRGGQDEHRTS